MDELRQQVRDLARDMTEIRGWLVGSYDADGRQTEGVLATLDAQRQRWKIMVGLLGTIAASVLGELLMNLDRHFIEHIR